MFFIEKTIERIYNKLITRRKTENIKPENRLLAGNFNKNDSRNSSAFLASPMGKTKDLRSSYDDFYRNVFEGGDANVKELFFQQIEDERNKGRDGFSPFLSNPARNLTYFNIKSLNFWFF